MEIEEIISKAIPGEDCPVKNEAAMHRRKELKKRIEEHVQNQLSKQFNARDMSQPYDPKLQYKHNGNPGNPPNFP